PPPKPLSRVSGKSHWGRQPRPLVEGEYANAGRVEPDRADRGECHFEPRIKIERHAQREQQGGTDDVAMADDHYPALGMNALQIEESANDPILNLPPALASRNGGDAAAVIP